MLNEALDADSTINKVMEQQFLLKNLTATDDDNGADDDDADGVNR